jgi:vancomycin resistance protein YoaR
MPPAEQIGRINSIPEDTYSPLEAPLLETKPNPEPPSMPAPPLAVPEKKLEAPKPIGSYHTTLLNRDRERMENIRLAIKKINGYKLKPGEIFSFNKIVGKRDAANGFKVAAVIINGDYGEDMGGGVCQVSSTIFNAADRAGMQIIERHSHSRAVRYVPAGRDAAVSYDYLDLKFKNNRNYSVEIKATIDGTILRVSIYKIK